MERYICIHGHFYQPPRENPWLEEVELQDSAYPYHDWNERINAECYAPNTASRIVDNEGKVIVIGNNYSKMSFNFGPTLLAWMERHAPDIYQAIQEADRASKDRFSGHGSAIAQAYNHMIMPLAAQRDKYTQIFWGIRDFERRFNRHPEGMWLPETAVDLETLDIMASLGIKFTLLSPYQAAAVRKIPDTSWNDVSGGRIDPTMPYRCLLPSGKSISVFFYDGHVAREVAFSNLLNSGEQFANRLLSLFTDTARPQLAHIATDGETYGHHHKFGDMALAYCLNYIETRQLAKITNYGEFLAKFPPTHEVTVYENSSWSCFHGIERWRDNCGCSTGLHAGWTQAWRKPLREAFDWLRDAITPIFEAEAAKYLYDPWEARNDYISLVLDRTAQNVGDFFNKHSSRALSEEERVTATILLEMERNAMLMYTSCGWFFDEVSGIESVQVLHYSCRALQLASHFANAPSEQAYLALLKKIPSNIHASGNGDEIYRRFVKPAQVDFLRLGAHYAISSLFDEYPQQAHIYCYTTDSDIYDKHVQGKIRLLLLRTTIRSMITGEARRLSAAVLHLGDHNINCGVRYYINDEQSNRMRSDIVSAFTIADILGVIKIMEAHFGTNNYSLANLFKDEQRKLINSIVQPTLDQIYIAINQTCGDSCTFIDFLHSLRIPVPDDMLKIMSYKLNYEIQKVISDGVEIPVLGQLVDDVNRWSLAIDSAQLGLKATGWVTRMMEKLQQKPDDTALIKQISDVVSLMDDVRAPLNLWKTQNIFFTIERALHADKCLRAGQGDAQCLAWVETFRALREKLHMKE